MTLARCKVKGCCWRGRCPIHERDDDNTYSVAASLGIDLAATMASAPGFEAADPVNAGLPTPGGSDQHAGGGGRDVPRGEAKAGHNPSLPEDFGSLFERQRS